MWDRLVQNCHDATVNQKFVEPIEKKILEYIATLSDADKREIWAMTETGQMNGGDPDAWHISGIEMDLEIELLDEMLDQAFRQAQERESNRKKRRTRPLQPTEYHG